MVVRPSKGQGSTRVSSSGISWHLPTWNLKDCHPGAGKETGLGLEGRRKSLLYRLYLFLKRFYLDRGEGKEKEREGNIDVQEKHQRLPLTCPHLGTWLTAQAYALTWNQTGDHLVGSLVLNPLSHTSQGWVQSFKPRTTTLFKQNSLYHLSVWSDPLSLDKW